VSFSVRRRGENGGQDDAAAELARIEAELATLGVPTTTPAAGGITSGVVTGVDTELPYPQTVAVGMASSSSSAAAAAPTSLHDDNDDNDDDGDDGGDDYVGGGSGDQDSGNDGGDGAGDQLALAITGRPSSGSSDSDGAVPERSAEALSAALVAVFQRVDRNADG
jgi:hypothetical protein